jgi:signal transduction histidine kinase
VHLDAAGLADFVPPRAAYDLAVMSGTNIVYRSNGAWPDGRIAPDLDLTLAPFGDVPRRARMGPARRWRLLVRRHDGSVDAMVASARRRNLAVSFGIVLILGITTFVLAALLRRAERLRRQQNEFIVAISHELNTPVAALRSAGENLRDGIIHDREKLARYGGTIVRESTRLGDLTAQVLELAGMQERRARPATQVDVAAVIDDAVAQCQWLVEKTPVQIETHVDDGLPRVAGDLTKPFEMLELLARIEALLRRARTLIATAPTCTHSARSRSTSAAPKCAATASRSSCPRSS